MTEPSENDRRHARRARTVAVVLCATMLAWLGAQWLGGRLGWPPLWALVFDFAALAAFLWAIFVTVGLWRARKDG